MNRRLESAKEFVDLSINWTGKVCIYGAGNFGTGWAYELIHDFANMKVDFYVDSHKAGKMVDDIEIKSIDYLQKNREDVLCFVAMSSDKAEIVVKQLRNLNINRIFVLSNPAYINAIAEYVGEYCDSEIVKKYEKLMDDKLFLPRLFKKRMGYEFDIDNPKTFNEKLQWLKVNERKPSFPLMADKYRVREYIKEKFGEEYLIPLLFVTDDYHEILLENIPDEHCIIKSNCGCHDYHIIRDKNSVNIEAFQEQYKEIMESNYYYGGREWHYKDIKPCIIIEKLLETKEGKIPNDYKLTFFNGELQFVYCSVDREGANYRKLYSPEWKQMPFSIGHSKEEYDSYPEIEPPTSYKDMVKIGKEIAADLLYVRVDFYDVDGKLYCGEITLCHGSGYDKFYPFKYDLIVGEKLKLTREKNELH